MMTRKPHKKQNHKSFSARKNPRESGKVPSFAKTSAKSIQTQNWLYGDHAVLAALQNKSRTCHKLVLTRRRLDDLKATAAQLLPSSLEIVTMEKSDIDDLLPEHSIHQGIALLAAPLAALSIEDLQARSAGASRQIVVVLDQVTDPHNIGAILRSAAAFDITALVVPDRHTPPVTGVMARSASGAVETVPMIRVGNLSRALEQLADKGFWRIGMDGTARQSLQEAKKGLDNVVLVLGSEGKGLRRLTAENCDILAKLPISQKMESLNVSNAAAISFYELSS